MHITYIYSVIIQNKGYAPGLALGRRIVSWVSWWWLLDILLHKDLLILLDHLFIHLLSSGLELHQLILYMHARMMQHLVFWQQQLLK